MSGKTKSISNPRVGLHVLDADEIREIHQATLQIMGEIKRSFDPLGILSPNNFLSQRL